MKIFTALSFTLMTSFCTAQSLAETANEPLKMLSKADKSKLEAVFHQIKIEFVTPTKNDQLVNACLSSLSLSESPATLYTEKDMDLEDESKAVLKIAQVIASQSSSEADSHKNLEKCLISMVSSLNADSHYYPPAEENSPTSAIKLAGIGVEFKIKDGMLFVVSALDTGPAQKAGIRRGDIITNIDKSSTKGLSMNEAVKLLRGELNSTVELDVTRQNQTESSKFVLKRDYVKAAAPEIKRIQNHYIYIQTKSQNQDSLESIAVKLDQLLQEKNAVTNGIILDLRNNSGGLLYVSAGISAIFLPQKSLIASVKGTSKLANFNMTAEREFYLSDMKKKDLIKKLPDVTKKIPLVVLINHDTASGSEIIASALQEYKRAKIIGTTSFGRSSLETIFPMHDGSALKLSTAKWYTSLGNSIESVGVIPDIVISDNADVMIGSENDIVLNRGLEHLSLVQH